MQEHLAKLAQKENESVPTTDLGDSTTAFYSERQRSNTEKEKAEMLVSHALCVPAANCASIFHSHTIKETTHVDMQR